MSDGKQEEDFSRKRRGLYGIAIGAAVGAAVLSLVKNDLFSPIITGVAVGLGRLLMWRGYSTGLGVISGVSAIAIAYCGNGILNRTNMADFIDYLLNVAAVPPFWCLLYVIGGLLAFWLGRGSRGFVGFRDR